MANLASRRAFLHVAGSALALSTISGPAWALDYPTQRVRIILGFPAGAPADIIARLLAQALSERLGQQVAVENRPGAGGNLGAEYVVKAPADGYTLLLVTAAYATNASLYRNLNYNFIRDIAAVASINNAPLVMVVAPTFPAKTVAEFITYAKENPGKINMASSGIGSPGHVLGALFEMMAGVKLAHVPYAGNYLSDLLGGQVQVAFRSIQTLVGYIQSGKLPALGVTSATRSRTLPNVPTVGETVPGYEGGGWLGIGAPRNTPGPVIEKLNQEINAIVSDPAFGERIAGYGTVPMRMTAAEFAKFIADETEKWAKVVTFAGVKPE